MVDVRDHTSREENHWSDVGLDPLSLIVILLSQLVMSHGFEPHAYTHEFSAGVS